MIDCAGHVLTFTLNIDSLETILLSFGKSFESPAKVGTPPSAGPPSGTVSPQYPCQDWVVRILVVWLGKSPSCSFSCSFPLPFSYSFCCSFTYFSSLVARLRSTLTSGLQTAQDTVTRLAPAKGEAGVQQEKVLASPAHVFPALAPTFYSCDTHRKVGSTGTPPVSLIQRLTPCRALLLLLRPLAPALLPARPPLH